MANSTVKVKFDQLIKLKNAIEKKCNPNDVDILMKSCSKELAARLIRKVVKRTPVGIYPHRTGGTLRRGWTSKTHDEAANGKTGKDATQWANSLPVNKVGSNYVITVINPVEYASYVEFGHRTRNHTGWVEGKFMLTISEDEIRKSAPKILEAKLNKYLKGLQKV